MPRVFALSLVVLCALTAVRCAPPAQPAPPAPAAPAVDDPASIAAINDARKAFQAGYSAGDADALGQLYSENAISEPNFQPTLKGRAAIVASLKGLFEQVSVQATLEPDETRTLGNVGLDRGTFTVTVTPKAGAPPSTSQGRYLVVYVKEADGKWRVSHDIDNAVVPQAAAAAAPAPSPEKK